MVTRFVVKCIEGKCVLKDASLCRLWEKLTTRAFDYYKIVI